MKVSKLINLIPFGVFGSERVSVDKTTVFANVQLFKNKHARVRYPKSLWFSVATIHYSINVTIM